MPNVIWLIRAQDKLEELVAGSVCRGRHEPSRVVRETEQTDEKSARPEWDDPCDIKGAPADEAPLPGAICKEQGYAGLEATLNDKLLATFPSAETIAVIDCLSGYSRANGRIVLRVEVTEATDKIDAEPGAQPTVDAGARSFRPHAYIVKIAHPGCNEKTGRDPRDLLRGELEGWEACQRRGNERGRIFMYLRKGAQCDDNERPGGFWTLKYEDAHQVLRAAEVVTLERAVMEACQWGRPPAESVDDVITQIFYEMSDRFYRRSWTQMAESTEALHYWMNRVNPGLTRWLDNNTPPGQCREEATCLLSAAEQNFVDPCAYLQDIWDKPTDIPEMQRGCSHGDLHGRNILVGMIDGQAKWPAVYDFEDMNCANYLGWDFVKLEAEIKVRALPIVLPGNQRGFVQAVYAFESALDKETERRNDEGTWKRETVGSAACDDLVRVLRRRTPGTGVAAAGVASDGVTADETADDESGWIRPHENGLRALWVILLGIRRMARICLETHRGRRRRWLDEYYFLLLCYGVYSGRFQTYQHRELLTAYVGAGTVGYRFAWRRELRGKMVVLAQTDAKRALADNVVRDYQPAPDEPSVFARIAFAREYARSRKRLFLAKSIEMFKALHERYPQLSEVAHELVFAILELAKVAEQEEQPDEVRQHRSEAERLTKDFDYRYRVVDPEAIARRGRISKEMADGHLGETKGGIPPRAATVYGDAAEWYRKGFDKAKKPEDKYYLGINTATCLWLSGDANNARALATDVLKILDELPPPAKAEDWVWRQATRAEANLLLGDVDGARKAYEAAAHDPNCSGHGRGTMKDQVNRILRKPPCEELKPGDFDASF